MNRWPSGRFLATRTTSARDVDRVGLGVELGPDRPPLAGGGVEQDDRLVGTERRTDVRDRCGAGPHQVEPGYVRDDHGARTEAVVAVPLGGVDRDTRRVRRHGATVEVHPPAGAARGIGDGEEVVREGHQALAGRDRIAPLRGGGVDRRFPREARVPGLVAVPVGPGRARLDRGEAGVEVRGVDRGRGAGRVAREARGDVGRGGGIGPARDDPHPQRGSVQIRREPDVEWHLARGRRLRRVGRRHDVDPRRCGGAVPGEPLARHPAAREDDGGPRQTDHPTTRAHPMSPRTSRTGQGTPRRIGVPRPLGRVRNARPARPTATRCHRGTPGGTTASARRCPDTTCRTRCATGSARRRRPGRSGRRLGS